IRDDLVTGVQTCALPSSGMSPLFASSTSFEVPWNDVDEAKSGLIPDSNKAMIVFQSGNSLSVWHGSPRAFLNTVLSNDKIDQNTLRRIVGDEALQSDYALYRTILQMTPGK